MSLRKKACAACVASKRRCDRSQPTCRRCAKQHLTCRYPLQPAGVELLNGLRLRMGSANGSAPVSESTSDNFTWDMPGPELNFNTAVPISHLNTGDLMYMYFGEAVSQGIGSALIEQSRPTVQENQVRTRSPSVVPHAPPEDHFRQGIQQNQLALAYPAFVPMLHDASRWTFCASTLVSYISTFAKTASNDFITPYKLQSPLTAALGVCAAHETLAGPGRVVLGKLIAAEIDNLIWHSPQATTPSMTNPSTSSGFNSYFTPANDLQLFRQELARVQAMTLYHIMGSFSGDAAQKRQAAQHEPLLAAWTTSLQERMHKLCRKLHQAIPDPSVSGISALPRPEQSVWVPANGQGGQLDDFSFDSRPLREDELECAHRTILISYFVRALYGVVTFGICPLISELESLIVSVPPSGRGRRHDFGTGKSCLSHTSSPENPHPYDGSKLSYKELLDLWDQGYMSTLDLADEYTQLLLVGCKGVGVLSLGST